MTYNLILLTMFAGGTILIIAGIVDSIMLYDARKEAKRFARLVRRLNNWQA